MTDDEIRQILQLLKTSYVDNWTKMSSNTPLFEIRVSLESIKLVCTKYNLPLEELYHILNQEEQKLLK